MAININYTPYPAVGELAAAGGKAQQAVRDQSYAFSAQQQANQLAEQRRAQQASIALSREQYQKDNAYRQQVFNANQMQTMQQGITQGAQIAAQEAASNRQFNLMQQTADFNQQMQEKANELATSLAARQEKQLTDSINAQQSENFLKTDAANKIVKKQSESLSAWMENKDAIVAEEGIASFIAGLAAINNGDQPFIRSSSGQTLTAGQIQTQANKDRDDAIKASELARRLAKADTEGANPGDLKRAAAITMKTINPNHVAPTTDFEQKSVADAYRAAYNSMVPKNDYQVKQLNEQFKADIQDKYRYSDAQIAQGIKEGTPADTAIQKMRASEGDLFTQITAEDVTKSDLNAMWGNKAAAASSSLKVTEADKQRMFGTQIATNDEIAAMFGTYKSK